MLTIERENLGWKFAVAQTDKGALSSSMQRDKNHFQCLALQAELLGARIDHSQVFTLENLRPEEARYLGQWVRMRVAEDREVTAELVKDALETCRRGR